MFAEHEIKFGENPNLCLKLVRLLLIGLSILIGLACLSGFVTTAILCDLNMFILDSCQNSEDSTSSCYIRSLFVSALNTRWNKYIMVSLLSLYASIFFQVIVESSRSNASSALSKLIIHVGSFIFGLGVGFPLVFLLSYIFFYGSSSEETVKSSVPVQKSIVSGIFAIIMILCPMYLLYFFESIPTLLVTIVSILLLFSPITFHLIILPFLFMKNWMRHCWRFDSHHMIMYWQIFFSILTTPFVLYAFILTFSNDDIESIRYSYTDKQGQILPVALVWSIDYCSIHISTILFIVFNEVFVVKPSYQSFSILKWIILFLMLLLIYIITPSLAFTVYIVIRERKYIVRQ